MPDKRVVQAGHLLAMLFVALLLVGAHQYLGAHPLLAGVLLAAFAVPYYAAARITGYRQFLYPSVLLLVLAYHLLLHGAGLPPSLQPLAALAPVAVISLIAARNRPVAESLYGANAILIASMALWILFRVAWFYQQAPVATALALAGFSAYSWFRFRSTERWLSALAIVLLGSAGFLFLLYCYPQIALLLVTAAALRSTGALFYRHDTPPLQGAAFFLVGVYLLFMGATASSAALLPLGYLVLGAVWLSVALLLNRPEEPAIMGPSPASLPPLLPLFSAGIVLTLAPLTLFYPWQPLSLAVAYLAIFSLLFLVAARELGEHAVSLIGTALSRLFAGLGRVAPLAALAYVAAMRFPAGYRLAAGALSIGLLSLLWAWREEPKLLRRRNYFAYQAGLFLILAYYLAERRLGLTGVFGIQLASGALAVLGIFLVAWLLRKRISSACQTSLYEVASGAAIVAALVYPLGNPIEWFSAVLLGLPLVLVSALAFLAIGEIATLFSIPVVLGFWLYIGEWLLGVRGEWLGVPYLVLGFAWAVAGYWLLRRASRWYTLLYFMWFLSVAVSLLLFAPFHAIGAWGASLWPLAFVLVARTESSRRDVALAWGLEVMGAVLAAAVAGTLIWNGLYAPAAFALLVDAALYAWAAARFRLWPYLYPSAACAVAAFLIGLLAGGQALMSLAYFLPLSAALYFGALLLRRRGQGREAFPLELAASAGAVVGAVILLALPFGRLAAAGWLSGLGYLILYWLLARYGGERIFFAGVGLSGAFAIYEFLPALAWATPGNRLAFLIPIAWLVVLLGRRQHATGDARGGWALYAAAMVITAAASLFVLWPMAAAATARIVLVGALAVWVALLVWTEREIFIYCATLILAMLAYHFVQNSSDLFGRHLVGFFLWGTALLGLVFVAAVLRTVLRFRRPTLFISPPNWRQRYLYVLPIGLLGVATFGAWGVDTSSNPVFCGSCHEMRAYYGNWKASPHAKSEIGCPTCHYEPGLRGYAKAKMQGLSELVITMTGTQSAKPTAHVNDQNCLRSGCHTVGQLAATRYVRRVYYFSHATHMRGAFLAAGLRVDEKTWRGPDLRCTSCHTDVGPESHFAVDTNACFTCHFHGGGEPEPVIAGVGCVGCHAVPAGERGAGRFEHAAAGVTANDEACAGCHAGLTHGSQVVEERRCRHCHLEHSEGLLRAGAPAIHREHVRGQGIACDWCHDEIRHRQEPQVEASTRPSAGGN